jgi:hypothetical protein
LVDVFGFFGTNRVLYAELQMSASGQKAKSRRAGLVSAAAMFALGQERTFR